MAEVLRVKDLVGLLDDMASPALAEEWDNVGLMVGDPEAPVSGIMLALDPTEEVLDEAGRRGCNAIVTHHPLIFKPLKSLRLNEPDSRALVRAVQTGIAVIGCHTNLDKISGGINDMLAASLGLKETRPLVPELCGENESPCGFGRIGRLSPPLLFPEFTQLVKDRLNLSILPVAGKPPENIVTVAVCGGSGSELAPLALKAGAQVYISGEIKHSMARWAEEAGLCLFDAGHFATENLMVSGLAEILRVILHERGSAVEIVKTDRQAAPFRYY